VNFKEELKKRTKSIDAIIDKYLPEEIGHQKTIFTAMNYSIHAGGKRLRPMLMQETYHLFGGNADAIHPFMAAIEMMHTASLVHDDLPAMDNDEFRRGKKTTWVAYGEDMAILTGDALMIYTFETAIKAASLTTDVSRVVQSIQILSRNSGIYGMTGGQVVDVELTNQPIPEDKLDFIYALKTGALLEASMLIGAVMAGASLEEQTKIQNIAKDIGLAFQIQDDILDVIGNESVIGKPTLSDEKNHKTTYVTLHGVEQAKGKVIAYSEHAIQTLDSLPQKNQFLKELIYQLTTREK
jgi:geranylgeranyl diphosphate synthase type II